MSKPKNNQQWPFKVKPFKSTINIERHKRFYQNLQFNAEEKSFEQELETYEEWPYYLTNRIEDNDSINKNKPIENQPKPIIEHPDQQLHQNNDRDSIPLPSIQEKPN